LATWVGPLSVLWYSLSEKDPTGIFSQFSLPAAIAYLFADWESVGQLHPPDVLGYSFESPWSCILFFLKVLMFGLVLPFLMKSVVPCRSRSIPNWLSLCTRSKAGSVFALLFPLVFWKRGPTGPTCLSVATTRRSLLFKR